MRSRVASVPREHCGGGHHRAVRSLRPSSAHVAAPSAEELGWLQNHACHAAFGWTPGLLHLLPDGPSRSWRATARLITTMGPPNSLYLSVRVSAAVFPSSAPFRLCDSPLPSPTDAHVCSFGSCHPPTPAHPSEWGRQTPPDAAGLLREALDLLGAPGASAGGSRAAAAAAADDPGSRAEAGFYLDCVALAHVKDRSGVEALAGSLRANVRAMKVRGDPRDGEHLRLRCGCGCLAADSRPGRSLLAPPPKPRP